MTQNLPDVIARIEKSGNRFNAWDTDGVKRTREIITGARKKAFEGNYQLGRFTNKNGAFYWKRFDGEAVPSNTEAMGGCSVEVPTDHADACRQAGRLTGIVIPRVSATAVCRGYGSVICQTRAVRSNAPEAS